MYFNFQKEYFLTMSLNPNLHMKKLYHLRFFFFLANCGEPNDIPRAILREGGITEGSVRIYDCKPGTVTEGSNSIVCQSNGLWSRSDLYCRREFI